MPGCTLRRFDAPDEQRSFPFGSFEVIRLGGLTLGRARYAPGWRWTTHVAIAPGHDSWVVGDEPYVSIHLLGADRYAAPSSAPSGAPRGDA
jgi:hypothetical protein